MFVMVMPLTIGLIVLLVEQPPPVKVSVPVRRNSNKLGMVD
jgi:hypothetical protein